MKVKMPNRNLVVFFEEKGATIDYESTSNEQFYRNDRLFEDFEKNPCRALLYFGFDDETAQMAPGLFFLHDFARRFVLSLSRSPDIELVRTAPDLGDDELRDILRGVPFAIGSEHIDEGWVRDMWRGLSDAFAEEIGSWRGSVEAFIKAHDAKINVAGRVFFHLVENKSPDYPFAFMATYSTEVLSADSADSAAKKVAHMPLKNALLEYKEQEEQLLGLLATVSRAAERSDFISELVESGELFSPLRFTADEAHTFLREVDIYEENGILCRIPDWWKKKSNAITLSISIGEKQPATVGLDAMLRFDPALCLGDDTLSPDEVEALLAQSGGLVLLKGRWVEVDRDRLRSTLDAYERASALAGESGITIAEAMRLQLSGGNLSGLQDAGAIVATSNGEWLSAVRKKLLNPVKIDRPSLGEDFRATLRHYQQDGFGWLVAMRALGFGALLADDMGLGKTVQILALLEYIRQNADFKALLVIPASLIGNWQNEIEKFAPAIKYRVLHTKNAAFDAAAANLFITTYGMAVRLEELRAHRWDLVILDEAQAIKNPLAKQAKAVKGIPSDFRIAMTGTPVENRLGDLWSIFDFLNSGLLGTTKEFGAFVKKMQGGEDYSRLREVVGPFILRRLKTDKSVIADLPDKIEVKAYAELAKKQILLYASLVDELKRQLLEAEGIARKGLVLASLMKFKQICNHPDQYLGQPAFDAKLSGKFEKLAEICETIHEKRERVLVFTQFREMVAPIADYLETIFGRPGLSLHGGTAVKKRTELVEKFGGDAYVPFMVLSLKAGGVGLNLTSANHVIHFDRWWNPAVENQATDRAFRIGQKKNVMVHKFVTIGTIEEKIDEMIEKKQQLAGGIIEASGENWITELGNDELLSLFTLSEGARK